MPQWAWGALTVLLGGLLLWQVGSAVLAVTVYAVVITAVAGWAVLVLSVVTEERDRLWQRERARRPGERADDGAARQSQQEIARQLASVRETGAYFSESPGGMDTAAVLEQQRNDFDWVTPARDRQGHE